METVTTFIGFCIILTAIVVLYCLVLLIGAILIYLSNTFTRHIISYSTSNLIKKGIRGILLLIAIGFLFILFHYVGTVFLKFV
jgi:Fe2+ transport system protein B